MKLQLLANELQLLGLCTIMYRYVPHLGWDKPDLSPERVGHFDEVDAKVEAAFPESNEVQGQIEIILSPDDVDLLARVVESVIKQCGKGDKEYSITEYRINFGAAGREDIEKLLVKLLSLRRRENE